MKKRIGLIVGIVTFTLFWGILGESVQAATLRENSEKTYAFISTDGVFFATTFCIKLQKGFVGCCTYIL